jgi:ketosteroid isomerase-like protein
MTPKAKGKPMEESSKYLVILKRQADGSWKISRDIENSNTPMPAPATKKL